LSPFSVGMQGTDKTEPEKSVPSVPNTETSSLGTLGTPEFNPYACRENSLHIYKDSESRVPSVLSSLKAEGQLPPTCAIERLPFLTADGTLSIPFDSPCRYHWWKGGQSVEQTRAEVLARQAEGGRINQI
jgi:hypothetical protein